MSALLGRRLATLLLLLTAVFCLGCSEDSPTQPTTTDDTTLREADSLLGVVLMDELNSNPQQPSDVNFSGPYAAYTAALANPNLSSAARQRARFGLAVIGMLTLSGDPEVNAAFAEWKAYLESRVPFEVVPGPRSMLGIPMGPAGAGRALRLPFDVVPLSVIAQSRAALGTPDPQIARVQAILRDRVIPRLSEAISHLASVGADPSFQFIVTPQMQGDLEAEPVEIDRTDALALRAACRLLASACHVAVAYRLNFPAYDGASLLEAIQRDSDWLGLLPDGATHMRAARMEILGSLGDVEGAIGSLRGESDDQDDDVIRVGPDGVEEAGLDSVLSRIGQVRQVFQGGYTLLANWDGRSETPMEPLTIRLRPMFETPISNWKSLLPPYTGTVREVARNSYWVYAYNIAQATFTVPETRYYSGGFTLNVWPEKRWESSYGDAEIVNGLRAVAEARFAAASALPDWSGSYFASASYSGDVAAGAQQVDVLLWDGYTIASQFVSVPVITWDATQFSEWIWPDPTMNGLFPDLTTTQEAFTLFGIDASQWTREVVLDWTQVGSLRRTATPRMHAPAPRRAAAPSTASRSTATTAAARYGRSVR